MDGITVGKKPLVHHWTLVTDCSIHPTIPLVPPWDISVILVAHTEKPFEPLASPKLFMLKVLFLIAAASARQVSELHALCIDPPFLLQNPLSFILALNPAFRPKMTTEVTLTLDIKL